MNGREKRNGAARRVLTGISWFTRAAAVIKLVAAVVFLLLFSPVCLANGLYGAAIFLAALGFFVDVMIFRGGIIPLDPDNRRVLARLFMGEHLVVTALAVVFMVMPVEGGWARVHGSGDWSDPVVASLGKGRFAVFATDDKRRVVYLSADGGISWKDTGFPGGFGWTMHHEPNRDELWVLPRKQTVIYRYALGKKGWERFVRPPGEHFSTALRGGRFYFAVAGRLYVYTREMDMWSFMNRAGFNVQSVAASPPDNAPLVLIAGRWWMESADGIEWKHVKPDGALVDLPETAVGGGGWRYVWEGGLITGKLFAAPPGKGYGEKKLPASDVRVLEANPADGKEAWIGTWGQGVYRTMDGGDSWRYMGLRRIQVRSLAVDFVAKRAMAASSNLIFDRGIFVLKYE